MSQSRLPFAALAPIMAGAHLRRRPWVLWLQDIFPDAATSTGLVQDGAFIAGARALERKAYASAARIVVISETFRLNLLEKGVPADKIELIHNPAVKGIASAAREAFPELPPRVLYMGNVGLSQGLEDVVGAFERSDLAARLAIAGTGERVDATRAAARTDRVELLGVISETDLERELARASFGLVTQRADVAEFNVPSKLMTLMGRGLPVLAHVRPGSEVESIISSSGAGWITDARQPEQFTGRAACGAGRDGLRRKERRGS